MAASILLLDREVVWFLICSRRVRARNQNFDVVVVLEDGHFRAWRHTSLVLFEPILSGFFLGGLGLGVFFFIEYFLQRGCPIDAFGDL